MYVYYKTDARWMVGSSLTGFQSGSFQHRCMAAALRVQYGPGWIGTVLSPWESVDNCNFLISLPTEGSGKQRLETRYSAIVVNSADSYYGSLPAEPDIPQDELFRLCREHLERVQKSAKQIGNH